MNLYFRLLYFIIRWLLPVKRVDVLDSAHITLTVMPSDLDLLMHINNGKYLSMMDLGRVDFLRKAGLLFPMLRKGIHPLLGSANIAYIRPITLFQRITLASRLTGWDEKWMFVEQRFFVKGELKAIATVKALMVDRDGKIPTERFFTEMGYPHLYGTGSPSPTIED